MLAFLTSALCCSFVYLFIIYLFILYDFILLFFFSNLYLLKFLIFVPNFFFLPLVLHYSPHALLHRFPSFSSHLHSSLSPIGYKETTYPYYFRNTCSILNRMINFNVANLKIFFPYFSISHLFYILCVRLHGIHENCPLLLGLEPKLTKAGPLSLCDEHARRTQNQKDDAKMRVLRK